MTRHMIYVSSYGDISDSFNFLKDNQYDVLDLKNYYEPYEDIDKFIKTICINIIQKTKNVEKIVDDKINDIIDHFDTMIKGISEEKITYVFGKAIYFPGNYLHFINSVKKLWNNNDSYIKEKFSSSKDDLIFENYHKYYYTGTIYENDDTTTEEALKNFDDKINDELFNLTFIFNNIKTNYKNIELKEFLSKLNNLEFKSKFKLMLLFKLKRKSIEIFNKNDCQINNIYYYVPSNYYNFKSFINYYFLKPTAEFFYLSFIPYMIVKSIKRIWSDFQQKYLLSGIEDAYVTSLDDTDFNQLEWENDIIYSKYDNHMKKNTFYFDSQVEFLQTILGKEYKNKITSELFKKQIDFFMNFLIVILLKISYLFIYFLPLISKNPNNFKKYLLIGFFTPYFFYKNYKNLF